MTPEEIELNNLRNLFEVVWKNRYNLAIMSDMLRTAAKSKLGPMIIDDILKAMERIQSSIVAEHLETR